MLNKFMEQLRQLWQRMNRRQRMIVAGGTLAVVVGVGIMTTMMSAPDYKPLMTGLEADDSQTIAQQLAAKKIDYKMSPDGKEIDVPASELDQARMEIASQGATHSGRMGFELFDKSSWGQTEFDEKVNYQRALEGELERTIATLNNVKSARVHLVMPKDSVFLDRSLPAKASVALRLRREGLTGDQVDAIARLVSGAVENLAPNDVAIIDADTDEPLNRHDGTTQGHEIEEELTKRLVETLGPVVGAENLRASVNVEYDPTSTEENEDKYDPSVSALLTTQRTREQTSDTDQGGVAGTSSNIPSTPGKGTIQADASTDGGSQTSSSDSSTFGVNKLTRHTILPAGRIRRITAAILVNDYSDKKMVDGRLIGSTYKRSPEQLNQLQALAAGVLGTDTQRGDVITVENMKFNDSADDAEPTLAEKIQTAAEEFATPLHYAALLGLFVIAWALIFRPMQKQVAATLHELSAGAPPAMALPQPQETPAVTSEELDALLEPDTSAINLKRRLTDMVQAEPVKMAHALQSWLEEPEA
ncbi:MAG TPA: flagellar basal-body MS-ring/collar protein FliF [Acidobacteriaceae bacterium]